MRSLAAAAAPFGSKVLRAVVHQRGDSAVHIFDTGSTYGCRMRNVGASVMYQCDFSLTIAAVAAVCATSPDQRAGAGLWSRRSG